MAMNPAEFRDSGASALHSSWTTLALAAFVVSLHCLGCAMHGVDFEARSPNTHFVPANAAHIVSGQLGDAQGIRERMRLKHVTPRERLSLSMEWDKVFADQLGSPDYVCIGTVKAGGNALSDQGSLRQAMLERAAHEGGDVLLLVESGTQSHQVSNTTPGHSKTNTEVSATVQDYGYGSSSSTTARGTATSNTTFTPPQTRTTTYNYPWSNGLVFKYVPGYRHYKESLLQLPDDILNPLIGRIEVVMDSSNGPWEDKWTQVRSMVTSAMSQDATQPSTPAQ